MALPNTRRALQGPTTNGAPSQGRRALQVPLPGATQDGDCGVRPRWDPRGGGEEDGCRTLVKSVGVPLLPDLILKETTDRGGNAYCFHTPPPPPHPVVIPSTERKERPPLPADLQGDLMRLGTHIQDRKTKNLITQATKSPVGMPHTQPHSPIVQEAVAPHTPEITVAMDERDDVMSGDEWELVQGEFSDDSEEEWQEIDTFGSVTSVLNPA